MTEQTRATITALPDIDARALLARNHVGRIAYSLHDRVDIEPISYALDDNWIVLRTSGGHKAEILRHHPWVAFQVDEIHSRFEWKSVVVHGRVQHLPDDRSAAERSARERALSAIHSIDPDAGSQTDAFPHRDQILRLHIDEITGRQCVPGA